MMVLSSSQMLKFFVIDTCPTIDKYLEKYNCKFTDE